MDKPKFGTTYFAKPRSDGNYDLWERTTFRPLRSIVGTYPRPPLELPLPPMPGRYNGYTEEEARKALANLNREPIQLD